MPRIEFSIQPSGLLFILLFFLHECAFLSILMTDLSLAIQLAFCFFLLCSGYYYCWKYALLNGLHMIHQVYFRDDQWFLVDGFGHEYEAYLLGNSIVTSIILILNYKVVGRYLKKSLVLFPGAVNKTQMRRLRKFLLLEARIGNY